MFKKSFSKGFAKKSIVGLDVGSSSVKAIELSGKIGNLSLANLAYGQLPSDSVVDGQIMEMNDVSNVIAGLFSQHSIKSERVAAGVSGHSVIIKNILVPQMSESELEESIDWHAEEHIPFDIADVSLDYQVVNSTADSLQVLMAACKRERIQNLRQAIQLAGKQPEVVDVDAFALQNCYELNYQPNPEEVVALLNIGASTMNINIVCGTQSVFTRDTSVGGNLYTTALQKELGLTREQAEDLKRNSATEFVAADGETRNVDEIFESVTEMLAHEISKTFDFYRATADESSFGVNRILVAGGAAKARGLIDYLVNRFEMPVEMLNPFRCVSVDERRFDPEWMREVTPEVVVAVGLALRGMEA